MPSAQPRPQVRAVNHVSRDASPLARPPRRGEVWSAQEPATSIAAELRRDYCECDGNEIPLGVVKLMWERTHDFASAPNPISVENRALSQYSNNAPSLRLSDSSGGDSRVHGPVLRPPGAACVGAAQHGTPAKWP